MKQRLGLFSFFLILGLIAGSVSSMRGGQQPIPPREQPQVPGNPPPDAANMPSPEKRVLDANEKDIKKKVEQLYQLATELKAEVDKTDSSKVLSLQMVKKAEEIEKLARDIKNRSKG